MKKILLILITLLFSLSGIAQKRVTSTDPINHNLEGSTAPNNTGFGLKGGINLAEVNGNPGTYFSFPEKIVSFHAGAYAQFSITDKFSVQPEVLFSRKGFKVSNTGVAGGTNNISLDYFDVPVLFSFRLLDNFSLLVGPQASLLITVKENDRELDKADYKSFDYGAVGGLEGRFSFFRIGARFNHSFENIYKAQNMISPGNEFRFNVLQFYLGLGF